MHGTLKKRRYRAIWISDIHLGTRGCKAEFLLDFLDQTESEYLYLVGDIFDGWRLKRSWFWPDAHTEVLQRFLGKIQDGTKLIYVPGNHDEVLRDYVGTHFGGIDVRQQAVHETADGRKLLVIHGDDFDGIMRCSRWLALLGDWAYDWAVFVNHWFNVLRRRFGFGYWSLSAFLKNKVKNAVKYVQDFEQAVAQDVKRRKYDGVVCGHIHQATIRDLSGVLYCNDGDWVESCTALVEDDEGSLQILRWAEERNLDFAAAAYAAAPQFALGSPLAFLGGIRERALRKAAANHAREEDAA